MVVAWIPAVVRAASLLMAEGAAQPLLSRLAPTERARVIMALLALAGFRDFLSYLLPMLVFLFGMGLVNPIGTALTLSPFGERAGSASALLGFLQMAMAALAIVAATILPMPPVLALSLVLAALTTVAFLVFVMLACRPDG